MERSVDKPRNLKGGEGLAARLSEVNFDVHAVSHTGEIRADLAGQGSPIGPYDAMIAGHARSRGLTLVTNNERAFKRVDRLRLENWAK